MSTTYIIAIGGTGSKLAEAIIHAAAMGIYVNGANAEDLNILFVDPDRGNGNLSAAEKVLKTYQACAKIVEYDNKIPWMRTKVEQFQGGLWSPFSKLNIRLRDIFKYDNYSENNPVRHLFDVLYTKEERDVDLKEGFRGRPSVGAAVMAQLRRNDSNQDSWETLTNQISGDLHGGKSPKVFLCGSIFGGTGASGFPTIGKLIAEDLKNKKDVKIGGLLMLPYFQFPAQKSEQQIFSRSEEFLLKTETALRYYSIKNLKISPIYLLGSPNSTSIDNFSTGGGNQRNPQHYLELYGALALRDFIFTEASPQQQVVLISRKDSNSVTWDDIPNRAEVRNKLINATQFAFAWLSTIVPDIQYIRKTNKHRDVIWYSKFFNLQEINNPHEQDHLNAVTGWCQEYLNWIGALHRSHNGVELINIYPFIQNNGELKPELDRFQFSNLPKNLNDSLGINKVLEKLNPKAINPPNRGFVGLAKALYFSIYQTK